MSLSAYIAKTWTDYADSPDLSAANVQYMDSGIAAVTAEVIALELALPTTYQPISAELSALAGLSSTGYAKRTGAAAWSVVTAIPQADVSGLTAVLAGLQPLDSDLTAIAALTTTTFGRSLLTVADAAAARTAIGAQAAGSYQASSSVLTSIASQSSGTGLLKLTAGVASLDSSVYALASSVPVASSTTPASLGTAAVGIGTTWARADHVHAMPTAVQVGAEPALGNPGTSGFLLSSTTAGARSWVAPYSHPATHPQSVVDSANGWITDALAGKQASLGFTPVQQGGGTSQTTNKLYIGWSAGNALRLQVDSTDFGSTWPIAISGSSADSAKLGGQLPSYYATGSSLANYLSLTGGMMGLGAQITLQRDVAPSAAPTNDSFLQAPLVITRQTSASSTNVAGIGFRNNGSGHAVCSLFYLDPADGYFKQNTGMGVTTTFWHTGNLTGTRNEHNHAGVYQPLDADLTAISNLATTGFVRRTAADTWTASSMAWADISGVISYGSTAGTVCQGNDSRLSDARTPTAHTHSEITTSRIAAGCVVTDSDTWVTRKSRGNHFGRIYNVSGVPGFLNYMMLTETVGGFYSAIGYSSTVGWVVTGGQTTENSVYNTLWHAGNLTGDQVAHYHSSDRAWANITGVPANVQNPQNYYLPLAGGTLTGSLTGTAATMGVAAMGSSAYDSNLAWFGRAGYNSTSFGKGFLTNGQSAWVCALPGDAVNLRVGDINVVNCQAGAVNINVKLWGQDASFGSTVDAITSVKGGAAKIGTGSGVYNPWAWMGMSGTNEGLYGFFTNGSSLALNGSNLGTIYVYSGGTQMIRVDSDGVNLPLVKSLKFSSIVTISTGTVLPVVAPGEVVMLVGASTGSVTNNPVTNASQTCKYRTSSGAQASAAAGGATVNLDLYGNVAFLVGRTTGSATLLS